jgi:hypothetical protein
MVGGIIYEADASVPLVFDPQPEPVKGLDG